jgi:hypothetical protein
MNELKTAIVISGMHRSGTSSIAGVISMLGASLPEGQLMSPKPDNPRGFFESEKIKTLNDRILTASGTDWSDWRTVNNDWQTNPNFPDFLEAASRLLAEEHGNSRFILLKDPRFSKLLPFWILALAKSGFRACHVIPVRHPEEVAVSLGKLHAVPKTVAKLTWVRHFLDAELYSRDQPRVFVFWDDLLASWERIAADIAEKFNISWPRLTDQVRTEIDQFLSRELRHYRESPNDNGIKSLGNDYIDGAFTALKLFSKDPTSAKAAEIFETIRADFLRTERIYGPVFADLDALRKRVELDRDQSQADRDAARYRSTELVTQLDQSRSNLNASIQKRDELDHALEKKSALAARLDQQLKIAVRRIRSAQSRLDELRNMNVFRKIFRVLKNDDIYFKLDYLTAELKLDKCQLDSELKDLDPDIASLGLQEILQLNGIQFLAGAYGRLLKRQPDESGISFYLPRMLDGTPKIQILAEIALSAEARNLALELPGLSSANFIYRLSKVPLLGAVVRLLSAAEGISAVDRRLRAIEQALYLNNRQSVLIRSWPKLPE